MKVRATKLGYDGLRRWRVGEEFEITPEKFSSSWMEKIGGDPEQDASEERVSEPVQHSEPSRKTVTDKKHKKHVI